MRRTTEWLKTLGLAALAAGCLALVGCNTIAGAGQDIQAGGNSISNAADKVKNGD
jgi:entericidin B